VLCDVGTTLSYITARRQIPKYSTRDFQLSQAFFLALSANAAAPAGLQNHSQMFQAICAPRGWVGASGGSAQQTQLRRDLWLLRAMPPPARFDRQTHLRIMTEIHTHGHASACQFGWGGRRFVLRHANVPPMAYPMVEVSAAGVLELSWDDDLRRF